MIVAWTGRRLFDTTRIRVHFFQGPLAGCVDDVELWECERLWGRLCLRVQDVRDPRGFVYYAQARALPRGYGVPERWMTVDERGNWTSDEARYDRGDYDPREQDLPWEEYGAEGDPGGDLY